MTSTSTHLPNGSTYESENATTASAINQKISTTNFQKQQNLLNGFVNGNNALSTAAPLTSSSLSSLPSYQFKIMKNNIDIDNTDSVKADNDAFGNRRTNNNEKKSSIWDDIMNRKFNGNSDETRIGDKNVTLHSNNPFLTNTMVSTNSCASGYDPLFNNSASSEPQTTSITHVKQFYGSENGGYNGTETTNRISRPKRPHSIAGIVSSSSVSSMLLMTTNTAPSATMTMTYSKNQQKSSSNSSLSSVGQQQYGQFNNSTNRPSLSIASGKTSQDFTLYAIPNVVQRRSHSTPRPLQTNILTSSSLATTTSYGNDSKYAVAMSQRPRSLDRATLNSIALGASSRPPPIPPSRRFSQPLNNNLNSTIKNSPISVQYPATTSSQLSTMSQLQRHSASGMRQSITFHGQLNRQTVTASNFDGGTSDSDTLGRRRKTDRPLSFAYGTIPDQAFLENQLRIYSEQLRTITESVRKYSEQAKILSEMKRQQQHKNVVLDLESPQKRPDSKKSLIQSDSNIYMSKSVNSMNNESNQQLRQFLDSVRDTMKQVENDENMDVQLKNDDRSMSPGAGGISSKTVEAKTPSDQLRQFLDAIRSNKLPEEQQEDLVNAADRFSKFKEKMEHSRSKSTPNFDKYQTNPNVSQTFTQVSDNLRIMSEDLATLVESPRKGLANAANYKLNLTNVSAPATKPNVMDFNQILDNYSHLTNNSHPLDSVEYLRKCSEALRHTSNQLRIATMNNSFTDSGDSSSCSTTPGSIREAVQNLLQQPRNGVQIMDDRMKLFIDILDTQSKLSQVNIWFSTTVFI